MSRRTAFLRYCWCFGALLVLSLVADFPVQAALRVQRPITVDGGRINQNYLYGEELSGGGYLHRGVDLTYGTGTSVLAIADGKVVDLKEDLPNGTGTGFGNYVLIQHDRKHFDRTTQTSGDAHVYSIYAHLSYNSVVPAVGQVVYAGNPIAQVDNTGNTTGPHLHLQICIHPQSGRTLSPNTLDSENTSRNPELWLQPFNYGGTSTGTVIGRVTDTSGNPISDRYIFGLQKPAGSGGSTYQKSRTYTQSYLRPDDIMVENWGTTDITPGTYHLYVKNKEGTITYEDLGSYTVRAGETTYVGLDPFFLPDTLGNNAGWNSAIAIRNNSDSKTEVITTTFFNLTGSGVYAQRTDSVVPQGAITITLPGTPSWYTGPAIVAASGHVSSAVVLNDKGTQTYAYNGIPGEPSVSGVGIGTAVFVPSYFFNYYNWWSDLYVQNAGITDTMVYVSFFNNAGTLPPGVLPQTATLGSYRRTTFSPPGGSATTGSIWITSTQPVAVIVRHWRDDIMAYEGFRSGKDVGYLPSLFKNYAYRWMSAYEVQEAAETTTMPWVAYYPGGSRQLSTLSPRGHLEVYMQTETLPGASRVSAKVWAESNKRMAMAIHHNDTLGIGALGYTAPQTGTRELFVPIVMKDVGGWDASLTVQNVGTAPVHVRVRLLKFDGSQCRDDYWIFSLPEGVSQELHSELPSGFTCSAWLHSSSQPIVAAVHHAKAAGGPAWGYSAP